MLPRRSACAYVSDLRMRTYAPQRERGGIFVISSAAELQIEKEWKKMPPGRGKKPAKSSAPRAPVEHALCAELDDLQRDEISGPEDSPGIS